MLVLLPGSSRRTLSLRVPVVLWGGVGDCAAEFPAASGAAIPPVTASGHEPRSRLAELECDRTIAVAQSPAIAGRFLRKLDPVYSSFLIYNAIDLDFRSPTQDHDAMHDMRCVFA